ncbi:hypothetical protein, partial [Bacillus subtilis]|uniref:hypothetical protein n=1 Tax=Bacillus subtilis TaxID=1423 RepID=UPI00338FDBA4
MQHLHIYTLQQANIHIQITIPFTPHPQTQKIIPPILSHILHQQILLKPQHHSPHPNPYTHLPFP